MTRARPRPAAAAEAVEEAGAVSLQTLRVAAIVDEFTFACLAPECALLALGVHDWQAALSAFAPHLLFVESAWWGHRREWHGKISGAAPVLRELLAWCRERGIPSVFWGKEDPVHFDQFLQAAALFDIVFTSDLDCVPRYRQALGHDRVHVLPFACQPAEHNPVELFERAPGACFAGSYYVRYPERSRDLRMLVDSVRELLPVDIFDRYLGSGDRNYAFPPEYNPLVKGSLAAGDIARAYKGYRYGINLNTVKRSDSMFARRVFELLGSGTTVISNASAGIALLLGDLVIQSDRPDEVQREVAAQLAHDDLRAKRNLAGVRKVMQEHTYAHRLATVASRALRRPLAVTAPSVLLVAYGTSARQCEAIAASALRQHHAEWRLMLIAASDQECLGAWTADPRITIVTPAAAGTRTFDELAPAGYAALWIAPMVAQDYYGACYLTDLTMATRYSDAAAFCKHAHFSVVDGGLVRHAADRAYRPCKAARLRGAMVRRERLAGKPALDWALVLADASIEVDGLAIDPFNYCRDAGGMPDARIRPQLASEVDDLALASGIAVEALYARADALAPPPPRASRVPCREAADLARLFGAWGGVATSAALDRHGWHIVSGLPDGQTEEVRAVEVVAPAALRASGLWRFHVEASCGLPLEFLVDCLDADGATLRQDAFACGRDNELVLPFGTRGLRLGWRITSSGSNRVHRLWLGWRSN